MPVASLSTEHQWWTELRQEGMLISPALLDEVFPDGPIAPDSRRYMELRDHYSRFRAREPSDGTNDDMSPLYRWLDRVLEGFLGHEPERWEKSSSIPPDFRAESVSGEKLRPDRVLYGPELDPTDPLLLVKVDTSDRVGMGKGRTEYGKFLELLRATDQSLGLITNGRQFRLCYAGLDYDSWVEWEADDWFESRGLRPRLHGFYTLLSPNGLHPRDDMQCPLREAARRSRTRQSDLSAVLGEQVREAVEELLGPVEAACSRYQDFRDPLRSGPGNATLSGREELQALYQATTRIVMRLVVTFYAEARGLLPRELQTYNSNYGLEGLYESLQEAVTQEGMGALRERQDAWLRILALFRLIHDGSPHQELPVQPYGGLLFRPGDPESDDPVLRALTLFEDDRLRVSDATVYRILRLLKIGRMKVKHGRSTTWASGPVDFSQLRTEYIGMIYEGLLDYQLKEAGEPTVFLNIGQEPILPLPLLENMSDDALGELISNLSGESGEGGSVGTEELDEIREEGGEPSEEVAGPDDEQEEELPRDQQLQQRAHEWARRAVEAAGMVRQKADEADYYYKQRRAEEARKLIGRVVDREGFYLSRAGGTRKGTGTFYTKPSLAVPTARRTVEPLAYEEDEDDARRPKEPHEILSLKVCDPACGSGSFLVAAVDSLTEALYRSVLSHADIRERHERAVITLPGADASAGGLEEETIPVPPGHEDFEQMLRSRLRRYVVERCIYGVDINPMAVELCRLSLWIETMDPELPFGFLDHKIKVGNSLVGCWFDYFQDYPIMAWERDGGDSKHNNGVHFEKGEWSNAIEVTLKDRVKPELREMIRRGGGQTALIDQYPGTTPETVHDEALGLFGKLHRQPISADGIEERERIYREEIQGNEKLQALREAFDLWCAIWFWPADRLGEEAPTPANFVDPREETREVARQVAHDLKFFHWELEFPDVFVAEDSGFDGMLGNPPWETVQPESKEFFSNYDPIYRTRSKQDALDRQTDLFEDDRRIERAWLNYQSKFKAYSNWMKNAANPWGYRERVKGETGPYNLMDHGAQWRDSDDFHQQWKAQREDRPAYTESGHPYRHQGEGKTYTYKMFLEAAHSLLQEGGRLGMISPSGLYTDKGSAELRELFLDECRWEWLFGFENNQGIFDIHRSYKFCPVVIEKAGDTSAIQVAFMRHDVTDWENAERYAFPYPKAQADRFSPANRSILEIGTERDLEILEKIYDGSVLLDDQSENGWQIQYHQGDFNMTSDSHLFVTRPKAENDGYRPDIYGRWLKGGWRSAKRQPLPENTFRGRTAGKDVLIGEGIVSSRDGTRWIREDDIQDVMLPVYEGKMVGQFDFSEKSWVSGKGRGAKWEPVSPPKVFGPSYLMRESDYKKEGKVFRCPKVGFIAIGTAVHFRTMISALLPNFPCSNSVPLLEPTGSSELMEPLLASLNSYIYDFALRRHLGYLNLNYFILAETPLPQPDLFTENITRNISYLCLKLSACHPVYAQTFLGLKSWLSRWPCEIHYALTPQERLRVRSILDALLASLYDLSYDELSWILRYDEDSPKSFWRVDKEKPLAIRHPTLVLRAFLDLKDMGMHDFLAIDDPDGLPGCGWQIPEKLSVNLNDDGVIEFDRASVGATKVRDRFGPRFYDWQFKQSTADSWQKCELHARNVLGEKQYEQLSARSPDFDKGNNTERKRDKNQSNEDSKYQEQDRLF